MKAGIPTMARKTNNGFHGSLEPQFHGANILNRIARKDDAPSSRKSMFPREDRRNRNNPGRSKFSYPCKTGRHQNCTALLCECTCGHEGEE